MNIYRIYEQTMFEKDNTTDLDNWLKERGVFNYAIESIGQGVYFVYTNYNLMCEYYVERGEFTGRFFTVLNK